MNDRGHHDKLPPDDPQFEARLRQQRRAVILKIQQHRWRHKWAIRTLMTLLWTLSAGGYVLAIVTRASQVLLSVIAFLLVGAMLMFHSRMRHMELQLEEIRTILASQADESDRTKRAPN